MSICDRCIHDEVCGLDDSHEEATTFCVHMIPKDVFDNIIGDISDILQIIDKDKGESEE